MRPHFRPAPALLLLLAGGFAGAADVPSPEAHLGFRPGADFRLAPWPSVVDYFRKVDAGSDRVVVRELGRTTEDRPYLVAVVSAADTIARLDDHRAAQRPLAWPSEAPGSPPVAGKAVVLVTCSIHSTETASTLMAMELLHDLATGDDPATREILDKTILLLVPSANPDGVDKVAAWYERTKGKPWEGEGLPELYHKYAGHDTNRDWFMLNLRETQLLTRLLYKEWFPTLAYDVHQMGSKGARMFVPPFFDPNNPNLDPKITQGIALVGSHMAADLAAAGKAGVLTNAMYDNWWNGGMRTTPQRHNIVAVLTEAASVKMASPLFIERDQLKGATRGFAGHEPAVNFVDPWQGGWWRLRDIVDYERICARSILTLAGRYKDQFRANQRELGLASIREGREEPPFAWVVPVEQRDPGTASKMVQILHDSGIEVRRARSAFMADGVTYPPGSWLLPADQPFRSHLKDVMERQVYPNRLAANGQAEAPYDVAGWTLPLQMGVTAVPLGTPYRGDFEVVDRVEGPRGGVEGSEKPEFYSIANRANDDFRVVNALQAAGVEVRRLRFPATSGNEELPAGTLLVPATDGARAVFDRVLPGVSTRVEGRVGLTDTSGSRGPVLLPKSRTGLYQPWVPSMDEGWTRLVLEQFGFPFATLHDADVRAGGLADRFDSILLPSVPARVLREGYKPGESEPAYVGGLGPEGIQALREFVERGGHLICLEDSCNLAIEEFRLPVRNVLKDLKSSEFYAPGSILRCRLEKDGRDHLGGDRSVPLTAGMPDEVSVYFDRSLAFEAAEAGKNSADSRVAHAGMVATYAPANALESGWLLGPEKLQGKAALADVEFGTGHVVLFGFPPQHRGQPHGTFRLLFNALVAPGKAIEP